VREKTQGLRRIVVSLLGGIYLIGAWYVVAFLVITLIAQVFFDNESDLALLSQRMAELAIPVVATVFCAFLLCKILDPHMFGDE
jgi:hypothetical protein